MIDAVYIHIPFCSNKCYYCDFNSYAVKGQPVAEYLQALNKEMKMTTELNSPKDIKTIFIGGGTPTVLTAKELESLFTSIYRYFPSLSSQYEFTIEANPGTLELDKLKVMKDFGVNRLSMGVQAFQDELLKKIGRIHTVKEVYTSIENAHRVGFNNINIDLMFGLPDQTKNMLKGSLKQAFDLQLPHFSVYGLKIEENTPFHTLYEKDQLPLPTDEEDLAMFLLTMEEMEKHGYHQYEISNFAKPGLESKHNINYWKNRDYYGLGAGAHGYTNNRRHENIKEIRPYVDKLLKENQLPRLDEYEVKFEEKMEDMMMLGLRMLEGVQFDHFMREFHIDLREKYKEEITKLIAKKLILTDEHGIRLSRKGTIYGNEVFAEFLSI